MKSALLTVLAVSSFSFAQTTHDLASKVNPFVGSDVTTYVDPHDPVMGVDQFGNTVPGAQRPFGMLNWGPDFNDVNSERKNNFYRYQATVTRGFSLTHMSGPGCSAFGEVPILPILGTPSESPAQTPAPYEGHYKPTDQVAEPGYFAVMLSDGIHVQLTAAERSGLAEFEFPSIAGKPHSVILDLGRNLEKVETSEVHIDGRTLTGSVTAGEMCNKSNHYRVYFVIELEQQPTGSGTYNELAIKPQATSGGGPHGGAYVTFPASVHTVHMKVGISYVSIENARQNMDTESAGWDFARQRKAAREAWNEALGHILVKGGTETQQRVFYTALYHSLIHPSIFSDINGDYIGFDDNLHHAKGRVQYANYSGWDIYRSQVQLIAMLFPKVASDMAQSLVVDAEQGGGLPVWSQANDEAGHMVGDPGSAILAGIYSFGAKDFDTAGALKAMLKGANDPTTHSRWRWERPYLKEYLDRGYIGVDTSVFDGAAATTLEYTTDDFALSKYAESLGDTADAKVMLARSANWKKLFDPDVKYIRARDGSGKFLPNFDPGSGLGFVEGNSGHYTWMIPYDLHGVIDAVGGRDAANARLETYFSRYGRWRGGPYFLIENEPSFGAPWIYNWTGKPWRAQEIVRKTLDDLFNDQPGGEPGNDDLGATSSWVVFAQLGIYPEITGVGGFTFNSPTFSEITLKLGTHDVHIHAKGAPEKLYVQKIALDGQPITNWWVPWDQFSKAQNLEFTLGAVADKNPGTEPPSYVP